ncbi:MAG: hypothetical protein Ta2G_17050 [Termitinemataceae bacterium]|nr:MAG: hypothetical protein Ta2G_17050 [Termitinemataceae bacterium]
MVLSKWQRLERKRKSNKGDVNILFVCSIIAMLGVMCVLSACHFEYDEDADYKSPLPEITMEDLKYIRVKNAKQIARMEAEIGDRFEERHVMELRQFSFEQYDVTTGVVDSVGAGGKAVFELDTGNVQMTERVHIKSDSEDMVIKTERFDWKDKTKALSGPDNSPVNVEKSDGTVINGNGFSADLRTKTFIFSNNVTGIYVLEDENDKDKKPAQTGDPAIKTDVPTIKIDGVPVETSDMPVENGNLNNENTSGAVNNE